MKDHAEDFPSGAERFREMMNVKMDIFEAQVRRLSELRDEGLLTDEEFSAKKAELLAQL